MELKNRIIEHMKVYGFDVKKVSEDTGISIERLTKETDADIDADDLCVLCVYLNVKPEELYIKKIIK